MFAAAPARPSAHRGTDGRFAKRRRIIDYISKHRHGLALLHLLGDKGSLLLRKDVFEILLDSKHEADVGSEGLIHYTAALPATNGDKRV